VRCLNSEIPASLEDFCDDPIVMGAILPLAFVKRK
jgi:hypothetical protein